MMAAFIEGPLWYFALSVFVAASAWKLIFILFKGRPNDLARPKHPERGGVLATISRRFLPYHDFRDASRVQFLAGYAFHIGLLALLFFAAPHVEFIAEKITGFEWWKLPHWAFIVAAELALGGLLFLILFRWMNPVTRYLSSRGDYIASWLVFLVMLSGCFALFRSHETLRLIHLFLAELMLVYFPFSSLFHALSFPLSRGFTGAVYYRKGVSI